MDSNIKDKIIKLENIQTKLIEISSVINNEDALELETSWKDKNSEIFINKLRDVSNDIKKISNMIDVTSKKLYSVSGGNNNE